MCAGWAQLLWRYHLVNCFSHFLCRPSVRFYSSNFLSWVLYGNQSVWLLLSIWRWEWHNWPLRSRFTIFWHSPGNFFDCQLFSTDYFWVSSYFLNTPISILKISLEIVVGHLNQKYLWPNLWKNHVCLPKAYTWIWIKTGAAPLSLGTWPKRTEQLMGYLGLVNRVFQ